MYGTPPQSVLKCPKCGGVNAKIIDSRGAGSEGMMIRRRRACPDCGERYTGWEFHATRASVRRFLKALKHTPPKKIPSRL